LGRHLKNVHGIPRQQQGALRREANLIQKDITKRFQHPAAARSFHDESSFSDTISDKQDQASESSEYKPTSRIVIQGRPTDQ
jgi:hypothetical protein